jgi:glycosyltransferase involved in cell wall biosynthesis
MKVLYLSAYFTSYIHDQVNELIRNCGVDAIVDFSQDAYCFYRSKSLQQKYQNYDYSNKIPEKFWSFTLYPGFPKNLFESFNVEVLYRSLYHKFREKSFDLIHAHTLFPSGYVAMKLANKLKIPFVVSTHGLDFYRCLPNVNETRNFKPYPLSVNRKVQKTLSTASCVLAVSKKFGDDIKAFSPNAKVKIIENSFKKEIFYLQDKALLRKKLNFVPKSKYIISVGNLVKTKGHIYLIRALPTIIKHRPNIRLIMVGTGKEKQRLMNQLQSENLTSYVEFHDFLQPEKLAEYYSASDLFVFPSLNEAFGIALVEAMACGLPAVATKSQGPIGIIEDGETGFLVETKSSIKIAEKVIEILDKPKLQAKMSFKAAKLMPERYGRKYLEIYKIYKELINE